MRIQTKFVSRFYCCLRVVGFVVLSCLIVPTISVAKPNAPSTQPTSLKKSKKETGSVLATLVKKWLGDWKGYNQIGSDFKAYRRFLASERKVRAQGTKVMPILLKLLQDKSGAVRKVSVRMIASIASLDDTIENPKMKEAIPHLLKVIQNPSRGFSVSYAVAALGNIKTRDAKVLNFLRQKIYDPKWDKRDKSSVIEALGSKSYMLGQVIPILYKVGTDPKFKAQREAVANAIKYLGAPNRSPKLDSALLTTLQDKPVSYFALLPVLKALRAVGFQSPKIAQELTLLLQHKKERIRMMSLGILTLNRFLNKTHIQTLKKMFKSGNKRIKAFILFSLEQINDPAAKSAKDSLAKTLGSGFQEKLPKIFSRIKSQMKYGRKRHERKTYKMYKKEKK